MMMIDIGGRWEVDEFQMYRRTLMLIFHVLQVVLLMVRSADR